jgi:glycosyltransferase involved in cell wall biosynthesis
MTNVCLVSLYAYKLFHPDNEKAPTYSGSEVQQFILGKELSADKNFNVSFMVGDFKIGQPDFEKINFQKGAVNLYKTVKCMQRNFLIDGLADYWKLYQAMKKTNADVYIIRGGGSLAGKIAWLAKIIVKKRFIYSSAHDRDSDGSFLRNHPWYIGKSYLYALNKADAVVCQHEGQLNAFSNNFHVSAQIIKTMYSIDKTLPEQNQRQFVLWVGRLVPWKNPEFFMHLAEQFGNTQFLMITNSDVTDFAKKFATLKNVTILANVPLEKMDYYFSRAIAFVNTSNEEGFPNTFVQAAKNRVPIISFRVNPEEMLEKFGIGRSSHGNFQEMSTNLKEILENKQLWHTMSKNAHLYALEQHDTGRVIVQYKHLFQKVLSPTF